MIQQEIIRLFEQLTIAIPKPETELVYSSHFELLIAVVLSAQATDKSVNKATKPLFNIANTPQKIFELGEDGLKNYMFSVAIENSSYNTYFTEKITDCFAVGTIPIFYGNKDIGDIFNPNGIIMLDDNFDIKSLNKDLYQSKINAIKENFQIGLKKIFLLRYIKKNIFI